MIFLSNLSWFNRKIVYSFLTDTFSYLYVTEVTREMKIFRRYNPVLVAKYVKTLFRGRLYIKDVGAFEFDMGKILLPKIRDKRHLSAMSEINRQVIRLQMEIN